VELAALRERGQPVPLLEAELNGQIFGEVRATIKGKKKTENDTSD
jgi:hypothetical protein